MKKKNHKRRPRKSRMKWNRRWVFKVYFAVCKNSKWHNACFTSNLRLNSVELMLRCVQMNVLQFKLFFILWLCLVFLFFDSVHNNKIALNIIIINVHSIFHNFAFHFIRFALNIDDWLVDWKIYWYSLFSPLFSLSVSLWKIGFFLLIIHFSTFANGWSCQPKNLRTNKQNHW